MRSRRVRGQFTGRTRVMGSELHNRFTQAGGEEEEGFFPDGEAPAEEPAPGGRKQAKAAPSSPALDAAK